MISLTKNEVEKLKLEITSVEETFQKRIENLKGKLDELNKELKKSGVFYFSIKQLRIH